jgi:hypothetical protein
VVVVIRHLKLFSQNFTLTVDISENPAKNHGMPQIAMRAKMKIESVTTFENGEQLKLSAVGRPGGYPADGFDEDNTFASFGDYALDESTESAILVA